jgi:hypothetical protein
MYYHFAILLLFRPFIKLRIIGSQVLPKDVCSQAADAIQGLLRAYANLYTLRRTPSFVPYFVLTSAIMHLAIAATSIQAKQRAESPSPPNNPAEAGAKVEPRVSDFISQGIKDLIEMAPCHHFAEQALNILRYLAKKWNIQVSMDADSESAKIASGDYDQLSRPYTTSLNFFAPNVQSEDFLCSWGNMTQQASPMSAGAAGAMPPGTNQTVPGTQGPGVADQAQQAAKAMENPLFWPFPMQGRPMMPSGRQLQEGGFVFL